VKRATAFYVCHPLSRARLIIVMSTWGLRPRLYAYTCFAGCYSFTCFAVHLLRRSKTSHTSKELEAHSFNAGIQFSKESVILRLCKDSTPCFLKVAPVSGYFF